MNHAPKLSCWNRSVHSFLQIIYVRVVFRNCIHEFFDCRDVLMSDIDKMIEKEIIYG